MSSPDREMLITDSQGQTQLHKGIALLRNMPNLKCLLFFKTPPYFLCHLYLLKHLSYFGICLNTKCWAKFSSMKSPKFTARLKVLSHKAVYLLSHTHIKWKMLILESCLFLTVKLTLAPIFSCICLEYLTNQSNKRQTINN